MRGKDDDRDGGNRSHETHQDKSRPGVTYLRVLVVLLILGAVMSFSLLLLELRVPPVLLIPIDMAVVAAVIGLFRTAFYPPGTGLDADAARGRDD